MPAMDEDAPTPPAQAEAAGNAEPTPDTDAPGDRGARPTRRRLLVGGAAVVVGAGAGVTAQLVQHRRAHPPPPAPAALTDAVAAERALIADLDATTGGSADVRRLVRRARADHAAHLTALRGLLARYDHAPDAGEPRGTPRTQAQLRAAEQRAATTAGRRADALTGAPAALLASIAACEASHADLLT